MKEPKRYFAQPESQEDLIGINRRHVSVKLPKGRFVRAPEPLVGNLTGAILLQLTEAEELQGGTKMGILSRFKTKGKTKVRADIKGELREWDLEKGSMIWSDPGRIKERNVGEKATHAKQKDLFSRASWK